LNKRGGWLISAESSQKGQGGIASVDGVLVFLLSSVERSLFGSDESLLLGDFSGESADLGTSLFYVLRSCS